MPRIRRVVTTNDAHGRSCVLIDEKMEYDPNSSAFDMWGNDSRPLAPGDDPAKRPFALEPTPGGASFRFMVMPPESDIAHVPVETRRADMRATFEAIGAPEALTDQNRHWAMHKTNTIDYIVVLDGEMTMLLDEGEVVLKPFDVVVQQATSHAWANRSGKPVTMMAVAVSAPK